MIKRIGHLAFTVTDMDRALAFYCGGLGFSQAFGLDDDEGRPWIVYLEAAPNQFIELFYGGEEGPASPANAAGYSHLCLEVDDIGATAEALKKAGIPLDVDVQQGKDLNYQCWVSDPDGNRIEFMQMHPESPQRRRKT